MLATSSAPRALWPTTPEHAQTSGNPSPDWCWRLEASYEACVLAALDNRDRHDGMAGSKKLFLTLLGAAATLSATRRRGSWMRISGER